MRASWAFRLALLLAAPHAGASDGRLPGSDFIPDLLRMQYAGQSGLLSVGTGYSWWHRKVEISLNYGYVPPHVADRTSHIVSERNEFSFGSLRLHPRVALEPALGGFAANFTLGNRYQLFLPKAQRDYYWPDALYFWFFAGSRVDYLPPRTDYYRSLGLQVEVGTINQYLKSYRMNRTVGLGDIVSLAVSAQITLK